LTQISPKDRAALQRAVFGQFSASGSDEYTIVASETEVLPACPDQRLAQAIVEDAEGTDLGEGVSGTVTIEDQGDCVKGSFAVTFDDDSAMTGAFAAITCQ
jgi:hypothetical protein